MRNPKPRKVKQREIELKMITIEAMVEVELTDPENFLKIKETLTRIGIASRSDKKLFQSCHILHKRQKYYIVHFKELFALDKKATDFTDNDIARRNTIVNLLVEWGLITCSCDTSITIPLNQIKIISHKEKSEWELIPKYNIGKGKKPDATEN